MAPRRSQGPEAAADPSRSRAGLSIVKGHLKVFINDLDCAPTVLQTMLAQEAVREGAHVEMALADLATQTLRIVALHMGCHFNSLHAAIHAIRHQIPSQLKKTA
jgi:hypothetical protein